MLASPLGFRPAHPWRAQCRPIEVFGTPARYKPDAAVVVKTKYVPTFATSSKTSRGSQNLIHLFVGEICANGIITEAKNY